MCKTSFIHRHRAVGAALAMALLALLTAGTTAAAPTDLATGVAAGVGIGYDEVNNHVYFVEFNGGTLKRINLTPACETTPTPTCTIDTVASGFSHPEDVAINSATGTGYVTTRDDPGTTGALWRVDLATGVKSLVTFNLGAPHQIVLDAATSTLYTVGFDSGILWRIDLTTGAKTAAVSGLGSPVGLAISADRSMAYVTEQSPSRVAEYDLAVGARVRDLATGLTAPFYLEWVDPAQIALYVVERDPANRVSRIDLVSTTVDPIITGLPFRPSGIALDAFGGAAFVATDAKAVRVGLAELPLGEPVFLAVGHVPSTDITDGYASTGASYPYKFQDAPFGGTMDIFGNLSNFAMLGATHYSIELTTGGATTNVQNSWTSKLWSTSTQKFEPVTVAPIAPGSDKYEIPSEYPLLPQRWQKPFLMLRWPSSDNGLHTFQVRIYRRVFVGFVELTALLPAAKNSLTVLIDNTAPTVVLHDIQQLTSPSPTVIAPCQIINSGPNSFDFHFTAHDVNRHMFAYDLRALWGRNQSATIFAEAYATHVDAEGPHLWSGEANAYRPSGGWSAACNCAHTFILRAWKRTTNGYNRILWDTNHQSVTINNAGAACSP